MTPFKEGSLTVFHGKGAVVVGVEKEKIRIRTESGDEKNVRAKDLVFLHGGPVGILPVAPPPEPDWNAVAELISGETLPFADFTELAYGKNDASAAFGAWLALQTGVYFKGGADTGVEALPRAAVEEKLAALRERETERNARAALLERIRSRAILPEDRRLLREIEAVATGEAPGSKLMRELGIEVLPAKAHRLLLDLGVWDEFVDPWPRRFGIETSAPLLPLPENADPAPRADLTAMRAFAVDDAESNDPDDALSFSDGLLYVHIADPGAAIDFGDEIDLEARRRGVSCYLPESVGGMLPVAARLRFGLGLTENSPALTFAIRIGDDGTAKLEKWMLSRVRVERLDFVAAAARMDESPLREIRAGLARFRAFREREGAIFLKLPEVKIRVHSGVVSIMPSPVTPERELVADAMLAAGYAVGRFAAENGLPFPFAVQPEPEIAERGTTLPEMYALRRHAGATVVSTRPGRHCGLGLEPYCRVTSPLRRYADLLAHYQVRRFLAGKELISADEIDRALAMSEAAAADHRKMERCADEHFLAVYLQTHPGWEGEGTVIEITDDRVAVAIPEFAYVYKCRYRGNFRVGDVVRLKFVTADIAEAKIVFHFAAPAKKEDI
ncbi:MAG: RNB domain-containing ribonuclease [Victivallaceae bacterium]|nr:RNB domain-containing ribonuclease [Victivallaceae bacterium]